MAGALDDEVTEQLFAHLDAYHLQRADADAAFADADQRADEAEERVRMLAAVVPKSRAGLQAHQAALDDAERDLMAAEDLRQQLSASVALAGPGARELRADWPRLTIAERREVLRAAIVAVLVRRASSRTPPRPPFRDRVRVVFVGEAPDGLADYRGPIRSWSWDDDEGSLAAAA